MKEQAEFRTGATEAGQVRPVNSNDTYRRRKTMTFRSLTKAASLTVLALTLCAAAMANIIPTNTAITGSGPFVWTYDASLSADQNVNSGLAPTVNPVPHTNLTFAGFFTIYDFAGYVSGSCTGPAGWSCTAQNLGFTPDDVVPLDNPNLVNITWAYITGPTLLGQPNGLDLGLFTATSAFRTATLVSYTARGIANSGPQAGSIADNVGNTQAPSNVPEPSALAPIGGALLGLCMWRKKRASSK